MLSDEAWRELLGQGTTRTFRERSVMLRQGAAGTHLLALTGGLAKVVCREPGGAMTWLAFRGPGDLLGEVSVFNGTPRTAEVVSLTPCTAVVLEAERFRWFVEQRGLVMDLMRQALSRLRESDAHRAELLTLPVVVRLARALLRLVELTTSGAESDVVRLTGLSQEEIAQAIGVTRNAAITGLQRLRESGAVETARRAIVIKDMKVLRDWATSAT
ncbi:Crp/Fnr family transcriptional regulator [Streptomyces tsukubensis]|uniref:Transcriptional regulator n=1 Tax=Streptomyces tsukubensis TaxID=83656 RepID=A0A1V4A4P0_9ACTN|nr:Crp/Fnr family transcriptional regulator [Streptomyces tsukubensis]OON74940.1 transcriptional regulator [Streptomyces tsukubensis]QFR94743.1 cyclic nucleotide-binding domain-containing protein [Streptomyces tsukubensis]